MTNFDVIDKRFGLTPWSLPEHKAYIASQYGALMGTDPVAAKGYVDGYKDAEKKFDEAYEGQRERLRAAGSKTGTPAQELPDIAKLEWDPTVVLKENVVAAEPEGEKKKKAKKDEPQAL